MKKAALCSLLYWLSADVRQATLLLRSAGKFSVLLLSLFAFLPGTTSAKSTTTEQAQRVVSYWLHLNQRPLDTALGSEISGVKTYTDQDGQPLYHVVSLNPSGFIIVAGDDLVEPIIAFADEGNYDPSQENPLGALVSHDAPGRVEYVRELETKNRFSTLQNDTAQKAQQKWNRFNREIADDKSQELAVESISDVRVAPLLQTRWNQTTESGGNNCYNLYTPESYPCGCVATAMSQVMRYFSHPIAGVGTNSFTITVDGTEQERSLRGGDANGGAYNWPAMAYGPAISENSAREAIGALTHDAGVSVNMSYAQSGSGANTLQTADALVDTFGYENAIKGYNSGNDLCAASRNTMLNPNLDASYPVLLGITGSEGGHAVVCDGYGYQDEIMYHHLNMGWNGNDNVWYNLPDVDSSIPFTSVYKCVYNIYTSGSGEIISGRITDSSGHPMEAVTVTAAINGGASYSAVTNSRGVYAIAKIPSASTYQINAAKNGYTFPSKFVSTGSSVDNICSVGNIWGADFTGTQLSSGNSSKMMTALMLLNIPAIIPVKKHETPTVTSATGRVWMDRNLGASRVATSSTDTSAYGDLYQWGRLTDGHEEIADGHEKKTSGTTATLSSADVPGHCLFITAATEPQDWRTPQNDSLWQGASGINNPCPSGFRLPTTEEWQAEMDSWSSKNAAGAFASPLKLVMAGIRSSDGTVYGGGDFGMYWSSTATMDNAFRFDSTSSYTTAYSRANGLGVRCIKDDASIDLQEGLVAHYKFEGDAADASANGHNGIVHGSNSYSAGISDQAISLDGISDYVELDENMHTDYFGISSWFKSESVKTGSENVMVLIRLRYYGYYIFVNNPTPGSLSFCNNITGGAYYCTEIIGNYNDNKWHHVVMNYGKESGFEVYMDGSRVHHNNEHENTPVYHQSGGGYSIGRDGNHNSDFFEGEIDEFRIYNRPLSQSEVEYLYNNMR